jgi:hypothetical protein
MAETDFGSTQTGTGIDSIGGQGNQMLHALANVRHDAVTHFPLDLQHPMQRPPAAEPAPPPVTQPATEAERRQTLQQAILDRDAALAALEGAQQAHLRSQVHRGDCQRAAANYAGLQAAISEEVTDRLRADLKIDMSDYTDRLAAKHAADIALAAAESAETRFRREHAQATTAWQAADTAAKRAAWSVADVQKDRIRIELDRLKLKVDAYEQTLARNDGPWAAVIQRLLADPQADIGVEVPDEPEVIPPRPMPVLGVPRMIKVMQKDGPPIEMTDAEFAAYQRDQRLRAAEETEPYATRAARAREAANRGIG